MDYSVEYDPAGVFFFKGGFENINIYKNTYSSIWNPLKRRWEFNFFVGIDKLKLPFSNNAIKAIDRYNKELLNFKNYNIIKYKTKITPYKHQEDTTSFIINRELGAILSDTGTGKTKCVVDAINHIYDGNSKFLIVVPNSLKYKWKDEFEINSDLPVFVVDKFDPEELDKNNIIICNYEIFRNASKVNVFKQFKFKMIVLDESTRIKHMKTKQAQGIYSLANNSEKRFILTGTLITQSMLDVFNQIRFLTPNIFGNNFKKFRDTYFDKEEFIVRTKRGKLAVPKWVPKSNTVNYLKKAISFISIRYRKEECLDLPSKVYEHAFVPLTNEQEELYTAISKNILNSEVSDTSNLLKKLLKLCQITSGFLNKDDGEVLILKSNKYNELISLLEDINPPVIIWHRFRIEGDRIKKLLGEKSIQIVSEMPPAERITALKTGLKDKYIIIPLQIGKFGLDLQQATYAIYFSNDFSVEGRIQSEDRIYRIGTTKATYIDLLTENTIDVSIWKFLKKKINFNKSFINYNLKNLMYGKI